MTPGRARELYALFNAVRICFNLLRSLAEQMHEDLGVNPSMRAVLEALATQPGRTVPEIARARGVSRQHVQVIMNALVELGLAEAVDNPAHRRSPLFVPTARADALFAEIRRREAEPVVQLADGLPPDSVQAATKLLTELNARIRVRLTEPETPE